ncbi:hypothetical protein R1flu_001836 [Riccia fluitans]|uniref:Transposase n=1 Tax=Riccia fluitans TaxID=41844 RepID=A0ABD1Y4T9_9MARC
MAPRKSRHLKPKEVKIPHLTIANRRKMETWGLGGPFAADWSGTYDNLVEELATKQKAASLKFEYRGKPEIWISEVWREVYNLPKDKGLGVCNEATYLGPYLVHFYNHFHEMDAKEKEDSKKHKALIQTISDSDTKTNTEDEKKPTKEVPRVFCEGEASGSKPLDQKLDFAEWENHVESLGCETSRLFEAFHVEIGSVTTEAVAQNMKEMFAPPSVVETDLQPWKEMVRNLADLLTEEQKRTKAVIEERDYFEEKNLCSEKIPEIAMWCAQ